MPPRRRAGTMAILCAIPISAWAVIACTHDFDSYEPGTTETSASPEASTGTDGSTTTPGTDGSTSPGADAATTKDAAVDCTTKTACRTTLTSCETTCDQQRSTCISMCGGSNKCKNNCNDTRDKCTSSCGSTCRTCAGNGCSSVCN